MRRTHLQADTREILRSGCHHDIAGLHKSLGSRLQIWIRRHALLDKFVQHWIIK
jgi:hypothetical protein